MLVEKRSTNDDSTYLLSARRQGTERRRGENIGDKSQNIERVLNTFFRWHGLPLLSSPLVEGGDFDPMEGFVRNWLVRCHSDWQVPLISSRLVEGFVKNWQVWCHPYWQVLCLTLVVGLYRYRSIKNSSHILSKSVLTPCMWERMCLPCRQPSFS